MLIFSSGSNASALELEVLNIFVSYPSSSVTLTLTELESVFA